MKTLRRLFRRQKSILLGPQTLPSTEAVPSDCVLILLCPAIQNMFEFWIMFVITTDLCFAHRASEKKLNYNILSIGQCTCVREGFFLCQMIFAYAGTAREEVMVVLWKSFLSSNKSGPKNSSGVLQTFMCQISSFFHPPVCFWFRNNLPALQRCSDLRIPKHSTNITLYRKRAELYPLSWITEHIISYNTNYNVFSTQEMLTNKYLVESDVQAVLMWSSHQP